MPLPKINVVAGLYDAFAYETITAVTSASGPTSATYITVTGTAQRAVITCETAQVRYRYDGGSPTSTVGHILNANDSLVIVGRGNIDDLEFIRTGATSGVLQITYEK